MCSILRCCLPVRSLISCPSSLSPRTRMRTRSGSTEPEGLRLQALPGHSARAAAMGGRWFQGKLMKMFRSPRAQDSVHVLPPEDTLPSPACEEQPLAVVLTFEENLDRNLPHEASRLLLERERRLFGEITQTDGLRRSAEEQEEVDSLVADYRVLKLHVQQTLQGSLSLSPEALSSTVQAVHQEDERDRLWGGRAAPGWRPSGWKELHDSTLHSLVEERMDRPSPACGNLAESSSVETDIFGMGRQLLEDLQAVVSVVKTCYPPEWHICDFYAGLYHQTLSAKLKTLADFGLEDKDSTALLCWVNRHYPECLQKPELAGEINAEALGKLLPPEVLEPLEDEYLSNKRRELMTYISRVLEEAKQMWTDGVEPTREDGCYVSTVAYDIIQFINGMVTSAEKVVGDLHKAQRITCKLYSLMQRFKIFQDEVMKQNRANSRAVIKANVGCIQQFRFVLKNNRHLFQEDVRENCLRVLADMRESAHVYLLRPVHESLKSHYRKLGTSEWLNKPLLKNLLLNIQEMEEELQGLKESCHQELICQLHQEVTVEYMRRLLKGDVKLKDKERQSKAYEVVKEDGESLHKLFVQMGSSEEWLKEPLSMVAEVLKLQELPAIQMQVASLGRAFPDLSEKHVSALLKLKTNVSRLDRRTVKETLLDTLRETCVSGSHVFFSKVHVK